VIGDGTITPCVFLIRQQDMLERDSMVYCSRCNGRSTFVLLTVHLQLCKQGFTPVSRIEISAAASAMHRQQIICSPPP